MMLASLLQEKCEEVYDSNIAEDSIWKKCKASLAAFLSGAIDGAVIAYLPMLISLWLISYDTTKQQK